MQSTVSNKKLSHISERTMAKFLSALSPDETPVIIMYLESAAKLKIMEQKKKPK